MQEILAGFGLVAALAGIALAVFWSILLICIICKLGDIHREAEKLARNIRAIDANLSGNKPPPVSKTVSRL